jgi:SAM-dependent methyltransferase
VSVKPWVYKVMYRVGAPWEGDVRPSLTGLLEDGRVTPTSHPRVLDLGCGSGTCSVHLAGRGFDVTGVDFTEIALRKAEAAAAAAGVTDRCRFVRGDLRAPSIPGVEGTFDLLIDFGTLDDLTGQDRLDMAENVRRLSHPGSLVVLWCFYTDGEDLPLFRWGGVNRFHSGLRPGEEKELFGDHFSIERLIEPAAEPNTACFLMTRR